MKQGPVKLQKGLKCK
uniref:Uncharacterized protein n=1 Tax=Arundo donax TaxID=35708 RepID=A0A0A9C041_ARUDO